MSENPTRDEVRERMEREYIKNFSREAMREVLAAFDRAWPPPTPKPGNCPWGHGQRVEEWGQPRGWRVRCYLCPADGPVRPTPEAAIAAAEWPAKKAEAEGYSRAMWYAGSLQEAKRANDALERLRENPA